MAGARSITRVAATVRRVAVSGAAVVITMIIVVIVSARRAFRGFIIFSAMTPAVGFYQYTSAFGVGAVDATPIAAADVKVVRWSPVAVDVNFGLGVGVMVDAGTDAGGGARRHGRDVNYKGGAGGGVVVEECGGGGRMVLELAGRRGGGSVVSIMKL